jgi:serine/threonine protein kinase
MAAGSRLEFTFHQCLGKGGFGEVYLATVTRPGGLVHKAAVKVLKEGLRKENEAVQRLRDEGRMLATLNHPCILRAHELTRVGGRIALITEYVAGVDLSRCAKPDRLLPPKVVIQALGEVADALECAWNTPSPETGNPLKMIHRDIKPENVRVSVHGQVKLLDFGIARTTEMHRNAHTQAGDLPFTPGYAAPEAFTRGFQGTASDIYALGVTMFRLLCGERLYEGMDLSGQVTVAAMPNRYAPFLTDRLKKVKHHGEAVTNLLTAMLAYEPEPRPSAIEVRETCHQIADDMDGMGLTRWARSVKFPPPRNVKGANLTGKTLHEDREAPTTMVDARENKPAFESVGKLGKMKTVVTQADKKKPSIPIPPPPPVPSLVGGSVRPATAPPTARASSPGFKVPPKRTAGRRSGRLSGAKTVLRLDEEPAPPPSPPAMSALNSLPGGLRSIAPVEAAATPRSQARIDHRGLAVSEEGEEDGDTTMVTAEGLTTQEVAKGGVLSATNFLIMVLLGLVGLLSVAFVVVALVAVYT